MNRFIFSMLILALPLLSGAQTKDTDFVKGADVGFLTG